MKNKNALTLAVLLTLAACGGGAKTNPDTAVADAQGLIAEGKTAEARILLKNALAERSTLPGARILLAQLALAEGDAKAASDELSTLDVTTSETPEVLALRARAALALGRTDDAEGFLSRAGERLADPERSILQAQLLRTRGNWAEALDGLRVVQRARPDDPKVTVEISRTLASMGNFTPAMAELDRFIAAAKSPSSDALRERADLRMRQGDTAGALKDLDAALKAAPADWPVIERLGAELMRVQTMIAAGSVEEGRAELQRIDKTWPGSLGAVVLWSQIAMFEGRPGEAVDRLTPIMEAVPGDDRLQTMLLDALVRSGNFVRAAELLEKRVANDPTNVPARQQLARLMMQQGRPDRVIELLGADETRLTENQNDITALLAGARSAQAKARSAITALTAQVAAKPGDENLRAQLATAQLANGDAAQALQTLGPAGSRAPVPLAAATRVAALLALGNEFESNRFVNGLLDPDTGASVEVLIAAGDAALMRNDASASSRLLDRASQLDPTSPEVTVRRASLAYDAKRYDEAEKLLKSVPADSKAAASANIALARVAEARGDLEAARTALKSAIQKQPPAAEAALMLAGLELRANRTAEMNAVLDQLAAATPEGEGANAAGVLLARNSRFEEARTRFRQALEKAPSNPEFLVNLAQAQLALGDKGASQESFMRAAALAPENLPAAQMAIRLGLELKDVAKARTVADALVKAQPNSPGAWFSTGQVALAEGKADVARTAFAKSTSLRPSSAAARGEFVARLSSKAARPDEPLVAWLARDPSDLAVRRILADHLQGTGQLAAARQQLETIVKQAPNDAGALNNLAWMLRNSAPAEAERLARQALAIAPGSPPIADTLGTILLAARKAPEAVDVLRVAAEGTQDRSVHFHYAQALHAAGQRDDARAALGKALEGPGPFAERDAALKLAEELKK